MFRLSVCDCCLCVCGNGNCAVLCFAGDFIREANRILKIGGHLKIVEVRSRFEKDAEGVKKFIRTVKKLGFECTLQGGIAGNSSSNKMFFELQATKVSTVATVESKSVQYTAEPCLYKRR